MVGAEGGRLLRVGMPTSGFWNVASRHLYPCTYRVHPDQKQLFGLRQGLEAAGVVGGGVGPGPWECAVRVAIAAEVHQ